MKLGNNLKVAKIKEGNGVYFADSRTHASVTCSLTFSSETVLNGWVNFLI
jgi:hypothetical protein